MNITKDYILEINIGNKKNRKETENYKEKNSNDYLVLIIARFYQPKLSINRQKMNAWIIKIY